MVELRVEAAGYQALDTSPSVGGWELFLPQPGSCVHDTRCEMCPARGWCGDLLWEASAGLLLPTDQSWLRCRVWAPASFVTFQVTTKGKQRGGSAVQWTGVYLAAQRDQPT